MDPSKTIENSYPLKHYSVLRNLVLHNNDDNISCTLLMPK